MLIAVAVMPKCSRHPRDLLSGTGIQKITVELKATRTLAVEHEVQLLNYLKATDVEVGLLLNFGPKPEIKRRILDNNRK